VELGTGLGKRTAPTLKLEAAQQHSSTHEWPVGQEEYTCTYMQEEYACNWQDVGLAAADVPAVAEGS
jgi:hypothetical protein